MSKPTKDFWDGFADALKRQGEKRPNGAGWRTPHDIAKQWGVGRKRATVMLTKGVKSGQIEFFDGTIFADGKLRRCSWYRQAKK